MVLLILAIIASFIPAVALYRWLKNYKKEDDAFKELCSTTLKKGMLSVLPVLLLSAVFQIILSLTGVKNANLLLYEALYTFIVLAFSEELIKYRTFRRALKKTDYVVSWLDVTILMTIVGIGFDLTESILYLFDASVPVVLTRGICIPHAGIGFLAGYFYGKGVKTGNHGTRWTGLVLAWLLHGLYDFSLSEAFVAVNDNLVAVTFVLAVLDIVLVLLLVRFVRKRKEQEAYTEPLMARGNGS